MDSQNTTNDLIPKQSFADSTVYLSLNPAALAKFPTMLHFSVYVYLCSKINDSYVCFLSKDLRTSITQELGIDENTLKRIIRVLYMKDILRIVEEKEYVLDLGSISLFGLGEAFAASVSDKFNKTPKYEKREAPWALKKKEDVCAAKEDYCSAFDSFYNK